MIHTTMAPVKQRAVVNGNPKAEIVVLCDAFGSNGEAQMAFASGLAMTDDAMKLFRRFASKNGFNKDHFLFVQLCSPMSEIMLSSEKRKWDHVSQFAERVREVIHEVKPRLVLSMGAMASRVALGRSVAITKARGQVEEHDGYKVMPMLSPGFVLRVPEHEPSFNADFLTLAKLRDNGWNVEGMVKTPTNYRWASDISEFMDKRPPVIAIDTETTGLKFYDETVFPFLAQFSTGPGEAVCVPIHERYWEKVFPDLPVSQMREVTRQVRALVEDPAVRMMGHNIKFDAHMLRKIGMTPRGWMHDTQVMAFQVNENAMQLNLDECIRAFVPEMGGYADEFNSSIDKSDMINVAPEVMLPYAGGDPDAVYRLAKVLRNELAKDPRQNNVYRRVQMPALAMFGQVTEHYGVLVDQGHLRRFGEEIDQFIEEEYRALIRQVPAAVRRKHLALAETKKGDQTNALSFTRPEFLKDVLFSKEGFNLKPVVFTDSTRLLPPDQREPSVSTKDHLPYFVTHERAGDFVVRLTEYMKALKMSSTYVGKDSNDPDSKTGFWKYIAPDGSIHPSFSLTSTNTGRTASRDPNGQNFPKRGRWAKPYLETFIPRPGHRFAASDLSQIELRLAAWQAMEPTMLRVYREGGDIHATTAATAMGIDEEVFATWKRDSRKLLECGNEIPGSGPYLQSLNPGKRKDATVSDFYKLQRYRAKAVNFGFIYGAQSETFRTYAKTQYGVDYTKEEAEVIRVRYFQKYPKLLAWHEAMRELVHKHGYVRSLHGAARHLPSIWSKDRSIISSIERQAINAPIQRFGSDLCLIGAVRFQSQVNPEIARVVLTIHDQVVLEVKEGYEEDMIKVLCWAMQNPPLKRWFGIEAPLPMGSDAEIGIESLGKMEEREDLKAEKPDWWNDDEDAVITAFCNGHPAYAYAG